MTHEVRSIVSDPKLFVGWWQSRKPEALDPAIKDAAVQAGLIHVNFGVLHLTDQGKAFCRGRGRAAHPATFLAAGQAWRNWRTTRIIIDVLGEVVFYRTPQGNEFWCSRAAWDDWRIASDAAQETEAGPAKTNPQAEGSPLANDPHDEEADGQPPLHPDDIAVDEFAFAMREKLAEARALGRSGWQKMPEIDLWRRLVDHVSKRDPVDVANLAMFLWFIHRPGQAPDSAPTVPYLGTDEQAQTEALTWAETLSDFARMKGGDLDPPAAATIAGLLRRAYAR